MTINEKALELHEKWNGKLDTVSESTGKYPGRSLALLTLPALPSPARS